uniref:Uncharacterized protein n=1 Tax=Panagrolaimus sp. PS1159 TaxID=55785 RepID=A0AC35EY84_9BILA
MNVSNIALLSSSTSNPPIYTIKHPYPQRFSLPFEVIKYMIQNCKSGKAWKKLIMTCKHFYSKKPVFPVKHLHAYPDSKCEADEEKFNSSKFFPKLWLYDSLCANTMMSTPKIYKFDLQVLRIAFQNLSFADYQKLTSSGSLKNIGLRFVTIENADDTIVPADKLLEGLDNLDKFFMVYSNNL